MTDLGTDLNHGLDRRLPDLIHRPWPLEGASHLLGWVQKSRIWFLTIQRLQFGVKCFVF